MRIEARKRRDRRGGTSATAALRQPFMNGNNNRTEPP